MGMWKWGASALRTATSWIPGLGTAVDEALDHWSDHRQRRSALAPLLDLEEHAWRPDSSPAALLRADFGIVPFHGREAELAHLVAWCEDDRTLALRLYTAPGVFGKTRLLRHVVRTRRQAGWHAGFLREGALADHGAAALFEHGAKPLLLVLDYAESRRGEVEAVVAAAFGTSRKRVRLVLLARSDGDWWRELERAGDGVGDFFQGPAVGAPMRLGPLSDSLAARRDSYGKAAEAFAAVLGTPRPEGDAAPSLDDEDFERVLLVHAAALAAVEGDPAPAEGLLDWLLRREERGVERVREKQAGLGPELQRALLQGATLVTLAQGADSREETVEVVSRAPALAGQPRARLDQVAEALHVLYRGRRWCDGVEPDMVGEHLAWRQLAETPELLTAAFGEGVPEARIEAGLAVLDRLCQRQPAALGLLDDVFQGDLARLALPVVRVAVAGGGPVGKVLAEALAHRQAVAVARQLAPLLPYPTTALRELAAEVERLLWDEARRAGIEDCSEDKLREIGRWANNLSVSLADLGRGEEALEAIEEAMEIRRELASSRPEAFRPDLATSLNNLSHALADLGRGEEALEAIEEAVEIRRELASSRPEAFRPDLATSLNNLSHALADLGRRKEALKAIEEAVEIRRELASSRPDAFRPVLATSLYNLSGRLSDLRRKEEALDAITEALDLLEPLFRRLPRAVASLMVKVSRSYERSAEACGIPPDAERLRSIREVLASVDEPE